MKLVLEGNHAASYGALLARVQVVSAYPITPQTQIVEKLAEFCAEVESEHSAMAACIGASQGGVRAFTATSSQGLALMHELLHWAGAGRLPIVLVNVNRALAPPWTIYADQTDRVLKVTNADGTCLPPPLGPLLITTRPTPTATASPTPTPTHTPTPSPTSRSSPWS
jgi:pyruvate/2-oxoacid:ferredoxin oxidoreductase alpha subunit